MFLVLSVLDWEAKVIKIYKVKKIHSTELILNSGGSIYHLENLPFPYTVKASAKLLSLNRLTS